MRRASPGGEAGEAEMPEMPPEINTSDPHPARIYDYFTGGSNHFAADRETAASRGNRDAEPRSI
jgi:hypothetical protein